MHYVRFFLPAFSCFLIRSELKKMVIRLNEEKKILKEEGITVDGIHYDVHLQVLLRLVRKESCFERVPKAACRLSLVVV